MEKIDTKTLTAAGCAVVALALVYVVLQLGGAKLDSVAQAVDTFKNQDIEAKNKFADAMIANAKAMDGNTRALDNNNKLIERLLNSNYR